MFLYNEPFVSNGFLFMNAMDSHCQRSLEKLIG